MSRRPANEQDHDYHHGQQLNDGEMLVMDEPEQRQQLPPTTPPPDPLISAPPSLEQHQQHQQQQQPPPSQQQPQQHQPQPTQQLLLERPKLTPRQKWLWAFNKISAQLVSAKLTSTYFFPLVRSRVSLIIFGFS